MKQLHGSISVKKLRGTLNVVPSTGEALLQVKTVEPTYERQVITADEEEGYKGLSTVIVGPKDRPLIEVEATDRIRNLVQVDGFNPQEIAFEHLPPPVKYACCETTSGTALTASMDGYSHYRLTITDFRRGGTTQTFACLGEFALYNGAGTNVARASGAEYSASTYYTNDPPTDAFDGDAKTLWQSNYQQQHSTSWLQVKLPQRAVITRIGLSPRADTSNYDDFPYAFTLSASNDGESWETVNSWSGLSDGWELGTERVFDTQISLDPSIPAGTWVLATVTTRSATTYPADWTLLHESPLEGAENNQQMAFLCKQMQGEYCSITVEQETAGRIYINLVAVSDIAGFAYHEGTEYVTDTSTGVNTVERPNCPVLIWGCSGYLWSTAAPHPSWACDTDIRYSPIDLGSTTAPRQANFWDEASGEVRCFSSGYGGRVIIDCVEVLTE